MKNKRKILFIVPLPPPVHGSSMMCEYIRKSQLINNEFECDYINLSTSRSIDEIGKGGLKKLLRLGKSLYKTLYKLATRRYDLCYIAITCHGNGFLKDMPFALLGKMFGVKLVIHQHNKGMSKDVGSWFRRYLLKSVYKDSTVILLSDLLYPDIKEIVDHDQVKICPNGIPTSKEFTCIPDRNNSTPSILFLSNLIPSKGVFTLLDALQILKDRGLHVTCDFVGGETVEITKDKFNDAIRLRGIDDSVQYLGRKYGVEKDIEFKRHDIFVFPTYYENECFPLVLLEAMQAGMPCISTDEGAIPDMLDGTGLIVPSKNSYALADAIEKLICNPELAKKLSSEAYNRFSTTFTLDIFESKLESLLRESIE